MRAKVLDEKSRLRSLSECTDSRFRAWIAQEEK